MGTRPQLKKEYNVSAEDVTEKRRRITFDWIRRMYERRPIKEQLKGVRSFRVKRQEREGQRRTRK